MFQANNKKTTITAVIQISIIMQKSKLDGHLRVYQLVEEVYAMKHTFATY